MANKEALLKRELIYKMLFRHYNPLLILFVKMNKIISIIIVSRGYLLMVINHNAVMKVLNILKKWLWMYWVTIELTNILNGLNLVGVYSIYLKQWIKKLIEKSYYLFGTNLVKGVPVNIVQEIVKENGVSLKLAD